MVITRPRCANFGRWPTREMPSRNTISVYYDGQGIPQNFAEALRWFRLAAGQGHAGAENSLGALYLAGQGVEQSTAEALRWYRLAAEQGYYARKEKYRPKPAAS
jgi:Sel1 repeat